MTAVTQITTGAEPSHTTYFLQQSFLPGDRDLMFISYATGTPQLYEISVASQRQRQLTHGPAIHPFSAAQHPAGQEIAFTRRASLCAVNRQTLAERTITRCDGASLGESSISPDGRWLTAAYRRSDERGLLVAAWDGSEAHTIAFPRTVIHPQFHPLDAEWI
jgi:Tol biopolymer transport system component